MCHLSQKQKLNDNRIHLHLIVPIQDFIYYNLSLPKPLVCRSLSLPKPTQFYSRVGLSLPTPNGSAAYEHVHNRLYVYSFLSLFLINILRKKMNFDSSRPLLPSYLLFCTLLIKEKKKMYLSTTIQSSVCCLIFIVKHRRRKLMLLTCM